MSDPKKPAPSRFRLAVLVFVFVYPVITLYQYALGLWTQGWPVWARTLVMVPVVVGLMVYLIIPFIQKRLGFLLVKKPKNPRDRG